MAEKVSVGKTWNVGVKVALKQYEGMVTATREEEAVEGEWSAATREQEVLLQIQINMGDMTVVIDIQLNSIHLAPGLPVLSLGNDTYISFSWINCTCVRV